MGLLDGKVVLVTGASSGIGAAAAREAKAEGAKLMLADVNADAGQALADELGAAFTATDVTDEGQVKALVDATTSELGGLDGAFNCAGILGAVAPVGDLGFEDFKKVIDVDLHGVFLCCKYELQVMAAQGSGSILNMSSAAGLIGWPAASGYVAAKHGVVGLTKSAALEYAEAGVRVNSICPSYVLTPLVEDELFGDILGNDEEAIAAARANHPIGRFGQPQEIATAVVWLLSDKASFVTGTAMSVDGGYTAP